MFVLTDIVYVTVPVNTLRIKLARTAVLVRSGLHILRSGRREKRKKARRWKARDRKKAAQECLREKTVYIKNRAMNNAKQTNKTKKRLKMAKSETSITG